MTGSLLEALQLPDSCRLGARITKKMLLENAKTLPADRKAIANDVESVVWQYTLKPSTIAIMPYADDEREYDEIAVLEATLKSAKNASRIAEVIHRAIPYPLVLVLVHEGVQMLSLAPKRLSRSEQGAAVVDEFLSTGWLPLDSLAETEEAFVASVALANLPHPSYLVLYTALIDRLTALASSRHTGEYHVIGDARMQTERRQALAQVRRTEGLIASERAQLDSATQFNRKVAHSTRIESLTRELALLTERLRSGVSSDIEANSSSTPTKGGSGTNA